MCANVHLQPIVILNEIYNVGVFLSCCLLVMWMSWFGVTHVATLLMSLSYDISITVSSPLPSLLPYIFLLYYFAHPLFLSLVSVSNASGFICLCVCHLSFSPFFFPIPLPLPDSWLVWQHQTACIFSTATDGAMAACQRPECSLSQLSGRSPGPKWIPSTWGGRWGRGEAPLPFPPLFKLRF